MMRKNFASQNNLALDVWLSEVRGQKLWSCYFYVFKLDNGVLTIVYQNMNDYLSEYSCWKF